jgi:AAA+ superfamily predicted ATPase
VRRTQRTQKQGSKANFSFRIVAEKLHAPLYSVSAGELGVDVNSVESKLQTALDLAKKWDAVMLLDEADVFLEQRTINDLERNRLVSVFLRKLEYYEGVLFLTTNRYREIDRAFQSRIDMTLEYPDLDEVARYSVWKNFFGSSKRRVEINDEETRTLAMSSLNGRQIKSIMKQAQLLAARAKDSSLRLEHVQRILRLHGV